MGDLTSAIKDYSRVIELLAEEADREEQDISPHNAYHVTGFGGAIDRFTFSIEIDPEDVDAYKDRGDVYFLIGQYDLASQTFPRQLNWI